MTYLHKNVEYFWFLDYGAPSERLVAVHNGTALISDLFYYLSNRDVWNAGLDAEQHYFTYGWKEGRSTGTLFDANFYLARNPDVAAAEINPVLHYLEYGAQEGRDPSLFFNTNFYLQTNLDVAQSGMNPFEHYLRYGRYEGRSPNEFFDGAFYLQHNRELAEIGGDPLSHYLEQGWKDGLAASARFLTKVYLANNPDVAASGMNPLEHYLLYGQYEGRAISSGTPAQISGPDQGTVQEDGTALAVGRLQITDIDPGEASWDVNASTGNLRLDGQYGYLTLYADGYWTYQLNTYYNTELQQLRGGETVVEAFKVRTLDYTEHTIRINVQGANDAPEFGGSLQVWLWEERGPLAYGQLTVSDPDAGESAFQAGTRAGTYGTLSIAADGAWEYTFTGNADLGVIPGTAHGLLEDAIDVSSVDGSLVTVQVLIQPYQPEQDLVW